LTLGRSSAHRVGMLGDFAACVREFDHERHCQ
jgi:hypothetical protein